jgi:excisionase family DNA binding protein
MSERDTVTSMPDRNNTDELLTTGQVAREWQVSVRTIQRYIAAGHIKATRLPSGVARIRRSDAEKALNSPAV